VLQKFILLVIAGSYAVAETAFFGWNTWPQTSAEVIADGIVALAVILAVK
jgi:hypothetical protein